MYKTLRNIHSYDYTQKRVLLIGSAWMAVEYAKAFQAMGISDVTVLSRSEANARKIADAYAFTPLHGGYAARLPELAEFDLVVLSLPEHECISAIESCVAHGQKNILVEKPCSLYSERLHALAARLPEVRVRVAYNRVTYPNFARLQSLIAAEGGATSCHYLITEIVHGIPFGNNPDAFYARWGCANTLHVISMAHALIGMPEELTTYRSGGFDWHPSGDRFHGAGRTDSGCLFSYQGDWQSAGRWGIDVMTPENAYRLVPMEDLFVMRKGTFSWEKVEFDIPYPGVKQGVAEELAVMLEPSLEAAIPLVTLEQAAVYTRLAEEIFGYESHETADAVSPQD
jgi:predicted dehydrogenase